MLVVQGARHPSEILQGRYMAQWMARGSIAICYIIFKKTISFKKHMKRGVHLLAPGPVSVKGGFVRELMLLLDGISVGGQSQREKERFFSCKEFMSLPTPNQHKLWQHSGHVFVCKDCGIKFKINNSINRLLKLVCGKPNRRKSFFNFSMWDHHWVLCNSGSPGKIGLNKLIEQGETT